MTMPDIRKNPGVSTRCVLTLSILAILLSIPFASAVAQDGSPVFRRLGEIDTNIETFHYMVTPGAATIEISAFGDMSHPGIYVLEEGASLAFLLALTGGSDTFNQPGVRYIKTVRRFRNTGGSQSMIYEAPMEDVMAQVANAPVLSEGDVVTLEVIQKRKLDWRDIFTIIGPVLSTLLLIDQLSNR